VREEILGHDLGTSGRYNLDKRLSKDMVEELRGAYTRCLPFLSSGTSHTPKPAVDVETRKLLLLALGGYSKEQVDEMNPGSLEGDALLEKIQHGPKWTKSAEAGPKQIVISEMELPKYLSEGWLARMPVNGSKFVVERAS
jgi:hypothetical protein